MDILESGEQYYLMAIDYFTRRVFGEKIENKSSEKILKTIQKWFKKTGMP
ncbi:hypothetical protein M153_19325000146, partial [Pseudoloma neurophilia]